MSLIPYLVKELLKELNTTHPYDHHQVLLGPKVASRAQMHTGYIRPWRLSHAEDSGVSSVVNNNDGLKISLDVQQFKPEELNVKVVDSFIVVEGKHEERTDEHGLVSRQFTRRYYIPDEVDKEAVKSTLSSDNVLQVIVPRKIIKKKTEINIPISKVNLPASPLTSPKPPAEKRMKMEEGA